MGATINVVVELCHNQRTCFFPSGKCHGFQADGNFFGEKSDTIFSSVVINGRGKVSVHLRTSGYLAQYVFLSAAVGHAVQFLQGYHFGVDMIDYIGYALEVAYIIHSVCIFNVIGH